MDILTIQDLNYMSEQIIKEVKKYNEIVEKIIEVGNIIFLHGSKLIWKNNVFDRSDIKKSISELICLCNDYDFKVDSNELTLENVYEELILPVSAILGSISRNC